MSDHDPRSIIERIYGAFNARDSAALDELLASEFVDHTAGPEQKPGPDGIKDVWEWIWSRYPDVEIVVEDIVADGDKVATRVILQAPSGGSEKMIGRMIEFCEVADGKVTALWNMIRWATPVD